MPVQNTLIFKFNGSDDDATRRSSISLGSYLKKYVSGFETFTVPKKEDTALWTRAIRVPTRAQGTRARETVVRCAAAESSSRRYRDANILNCSVPVSRLPQLLEEAKQFITSQGLSAEFVSHVQDGESDFLSMV